MPSGVLRVNARPAKIKLRIKSSGAPASANVEITDVMFQPGAAVSGWLPHVTELPWVAGVTEMDSGGGSVVVRWEDIEGKPMIFPPATHTHPMAEVIGLNDALAGKASVPSVASIVTASKKWAGLVAAHDSAVSVEFDPDYGWISWIDLSKLSTVGDVAFSFPHSIPTHTAARPYGWRMDVLTETVLGVTALQPRVDYMNGATVTGSNAELTLSPWPTWGYAVAHDFIVPASRAARPTFVIVGNTAASSGRIGLTRPKMGTKSEVSQ
ncbi:hypothetical protein [Glutamicibacter soli]